jgi:hypothetical protein
LGQNTIGCERVYQREVARGRLRGNSNRYYVRKRRPKSPEWTDAITSLISAYGWAAMKLREIPDDPLPLIRGPALPKTGDTRLDYLAALWEVGLTKDADAALRAAYEALARFYRVTNPEG